MIDTVRYAWRETVRRKGRSLSSIVGYLVATGFLVIAVSALYSSMGAASSALWHTGIQFVGFVMQMEGEKPPIDLVDPEHEGFCSYENPTMLFPVSRIDEMNKSPDVGDASPLLSFRIKPKEESARTWILVGFDPTRMEAVREVGCSATEIVAGRAIKPGDSGVVVLEQTFSENEGLGVGAPVRLGGRDFKVVGLLSPGNRPAKGDVYMPLAEATAVVNTRLLKPLEDQVNLALVYGANPLVNFRAIAHVKATLGVNSATGGFGCFEPAGQAIGLTRNGMLLLMVVVALGVVALSMRSQYSSVVERRRDIGILKAIGWSDRSVVLQVLAESVIHSLLGGLGGCIVAALLFAAYPVGEWLGLAGVHLSANPSVLAYGLALTVLAGAMAGILPALAAARTRPADVLRRL